MRQAQQDVLETGQTTQNATFADAIASGLRELDLLFNDRERKEGGRRKRILRMRNEETYDNRQSPSAVVPATPNSNDIQPRLLSQCSAHSFVIEGGEARASARHYQLFVVGI